MKLTFLFFLAGLLQLSASVYSQTTKLSLEMRNAKVAEVLDAIENQSEFRFAYSPGLIDLDRKVTVKIRNKTIDESLKEIFTGAQVEYSVYDRHILLYPESMSPDAEPLVSHATGAQQRTVSGKVTDDTGQPLPGVTIVIKGTTRGTVTNADGEYSISSLPEDATLVFSFVGMRGQEVVVGSQASMDIVMEEDIIGLDEVVAIGYGTVKKSDLTGAVERVNTEDFNTKSLTNVVEALAGTVSGLYSVQGTSAAGGGSIEIRGTNSLAANINPLIVLDGVIYSGTIRDINPNDIESIDILKDASSTAVFGSRSASGVIVITTKKGRETKPTINFSTKLGIVGLTKHLYPFGPDEYLQLKVDYFKRMKGTNFPEGYFENPFDLPPGLTLEEWKNFDITPTDNPSEMWMGRLSFSPRETENYLTGKTFDWYDKIINNGIRQDYDLSVSGGLENLQYYFSAGYLHNKGFEMGDEFKTFRTRINVSADLSSFLQLGVNAQFADRNEGFYRIDILEAVKQSPWTQMRDEDGNMYYWPNEDQLVTNPFTYYDNRQIHNKTQTLFAVLFGELTLPYGLSYRLNYSSNYLWNKNYLFDPIETPRGLTNNGYAQRYLRNVNNWMFDNIIKWNHIIAEVHNFDFTFLVNFEENKSWTDNQTNYGMEPSLALGYHALQAGTYPEIQNNDIVTTGNALMARLNYVLKNRYMLTVAWRRDGFSAFGQGNPYAEFPSTAVAWTISEEDFFKVDWISNLKMRFSWGENGNRDIGAYDALARLSTINYLYGNTAATGVYSSTMANSKLRWEKTESINLGIDFGLLKSRIFGSIDLYKSNTTDLLLRRSLPELIGYSSVMSNLGELENKGIEITLNSVNISTPDVTWKSNLIFSLNKNKIVSLYGDIIDVYDEAGNVIGQKEADDITNEWFIGQSIDRIWDYEVLGVWQIDEAAKAAVYGKEPGDFKLKDVNGDDRYQPADDKVFQGYKKPQYRIGFRNEVTFLKNFSFSADIRADLGFAGANNLYTGHSTNQPWDRRNTWVFSYWTPDNPSNEWARLVMDMSSPSFNVWKDRSFVRIQDMTFAYNFPKEIIQQINLENLKIFTNLHNYVTLTKWSHYDPESGMQPMPKYVTFGLNVGF